MSGMDFERALANMFGASSGADLETLLSAASGANPFASAGFNPFASSGNDPDFAAMLASAGAMDFSDPFASAGFNPFASAGNDFSMFASGGDDAIMAVAGALMRHPQGKQVVTRLVQAAHKAGVTKGAQGAANMMRQGQPQNQNRNEFPADAAARPRRLPVNFRRVFDPGQSADITAKPQVPVRGGRLIIPKLFGGAFEIQDIKVGMSSIFTNATAMSALVFSEDSTDADIIIPPAFVGQDITILASNIDLGAPQTFYATLMADTVAVKVV